MKTIRKRIAKKITARTQWEAEQRDIERSRIDQAREKYRDVHSFDRLNRKWVDNLREKDGRAQWELACDIGLNPSEFKRMLGGERYMDFVYAVALAVELRVTFLEVLRHFGYKIPARVLKRE